MEKEKNTSCMRKWGENIKKIKNFLLGVKTNEEEKTEIKKENKIEKKEEDELTKKIKKIIKVPYYIEKYRDELEEKIKEIKEKEEIKAIDLWEIKILARKAEDERYERIAYDALIMFYTNKKEERVEEVYKEMMNRWPQDLDIIKGYVASLIERGKYKEAREELDKFRRNGEEKWRTYCFLGDICFGEGDVAEAKKYYKLAVEENPALEEAEEKLINILLLEGKTEEATKLKEVLEERRNKIEKELEEAYERWLNGDCWSR